MLPQNNEGHKKMVVICYHNFKDETLMKRQQENQKMNGMGEKFKDENKRNNCQKLFLFAIES
jgi:hypothetical protein